MIEVPNLEKCMEILRKTGIRTAKYTTVKNEKELSKKLKRISFPVVLKIVAKGITHKAEVNGVILGIKNKEELEKSIIDLKKEMLKRKIKVEKFMIQEQVDGIETIIGIKKDVVFGQVIVFGIGGKSISKNFSLRVCPVNNDEAIKMIQEINEYEILKTYKNVGVNISDIANTIVRISKFAISKDIKEMDINPFIVNEREGKAVDARIMF
jgi:acyl-CoA synthetase (NDP forming)